MSARSYAEYYGGAGGIVIGAATQVVDGSIMARVGEVKIIAIPCNQDITNETLAFLVETRIGTDVATVSNAAIDKNGETATLTLTDPMTESERTLNWTLYMTDTEETVASGLLFCTYDAEGDS